MEHQLPRIKNDYILRHLVHFDDTKWLLAAAILLNNTFVDYILTSTNYQMRPLKVNTNKIIFVPLLNFSNVSNNK